MSKKKIVSKVLLICLFLLLTYSGVHCIQLANQNKEYQSQIVELNIQINDLNTGLNDIGSQLDESKLYITTLEKKNDECESRVATYKDKCIDYESRIKKHQNEERSKNSKSSKGNLSRDTGFRSWMPYTALRSGTPQYKVVHIASPNEYGILECKGRAVVALGTGWGFTIGDTATIHTTNGSFKIVVGDWKANCDTDASNKVTVSNGCVAEFIVDRSRLAGCIRTSGSVASVSKYSGKVTSITSDGSNILKG